MIQPEPFHVHYRDLLYNLLGGRHDPVMVRNERTGTSIAVLPDVFDSFTLDLSDRRIPVPGNRRVFPRTAAAEQAWFINGQQDVTWLRQYAPIWDKFVEEDGVTVEAAYGYRWRQRFGRDQLVCAEHALKKDPTDRRILVAAWDPSQDGLGVPSKNVPCPTHFTLSIGERHGAKCLNSAMFVRSSDVFVGLPYDVMGHAFLVNALADSLAVEPGLMHFTLAHPHMYETHIADAIESLHSSIVAEGPAVPHDWPVSRIELQSEDYMDAVAFACDAVADHPLVFKPKLVV
jgi:thymidylate synthase